jgi:hypothetical protein
MIAPWQIGQKYLQDRTCEDIRNKIASDTLKNGIRKLGYANYVKRDGDEAVARVTSFFSR